MSNEIKKKYQLFINMDKADIPATLFVTDSKSEFFGQVDEEASMKADARWLPFWQEEERKVLEGVIIDGFQFTGWLYWHINHWWINKDKKLPNGDIIPNEGRPDLRDNELIINNGLRRAQDPLNRRHLLILGARQISKTTFEASFLGRSGLIYKGSQNLILSTGAGDLNNITASLDFGLLNCSKFFYVNRINKDWKDERVVLGTETKGRDRKVWSQYIIRNTSAGQNTEAGAGVTIKSGVYDEIGKRKWLESFKAAEKAMVSRYGIRAVFIAVGTGGSFENGEDAKRAFFNPASGKFVEYTQPSGQVTGLFISGLFRQDCKVETNLGDYLKTQDAKDLFGEMIPDSIPDDSELYKTVLHIADKEKAYNEIMKDREAARLDPDPRLYIKTIAYDPLTVDEIFLTDSNNQFAHLFEDMKKHETDISENLNPRPVELKREPDQSVSYTFSYKTPVFNFPINNKTLTDAPVMIYEEPIKGLPYSTYVCGIDPYNQDRSSDREPSLGVCYIYKRMYDPFGYFQNAIVASYAGRPGTVNDFYRICENMIELYGAVALPENESSIIQYFITKNKEHLLFDSPALTRYVNPQSTTASRQKGFAATTPNQKHYMKLMLQYAEEPIKEVFKNGTELLKFGLIRIPDKMLIQEMMNYRGKDANATRGVHDGNFDRICAFGHCLTLANYLDRDFPVLGKYREVEEKKPKGPTFISPFGVTRITGHNTISPFNLGGRKAGSVF